MGRLPGFDYRRPFYYMVTLKRRPRLADFSSLAPGGVPPPRDADGRERWLVPNAVTRAFFRVIRSLSENRRGIAPVKHFVVMPDHLHLLLKIENTPDRFPLGTYVLHLERALCAVFWATTEPDGTGAILQNRESAGFGRAVPVPPIFEGDWHDWIVMKRGQLDAIARYIRENPRRAWLRREKRRFFTRPGKLSFADRDWFSYGNPALLDLPVLEAFRAPARGPLTASSGAKRSPVPSVPAPVGWGRERS